MQLQKSPNNIRDRIFQNQISTVKTKANDGNPQLTLYIYIICTHYYQSVCISHMYNYYVSINHPLSVQLSVQVLYKIAHALKF